MESALGALPIKLRRPNRSIFKTTGGEGFCRRILSRSCQFNVLIELVIADITRTPRAHPRSETFKAGFQQLTDAGVDLFLASPIPELPTIPRVDDEFPLVLAPSRDEFIGRLDLLIGRELHEGIHVEQSQYPGGDLLTEFLGKLHDP